MKKCLFHLVLQGLGVCTFDWNGSDLHRAGAGARARSSWCRSCLVSMSVCKEWLADPDLGLYSVLVLALVQEKDETNSSVGQKLYRAREEAGSKRKYDGGEQGQYCRVTSVRVLHVPGC